jgi:hypothetical protein
MMAHAEIPTLAAAKAFAEYTCRFPEFESLFLRIEAAGFPLGIEARLRCWVVLSRLIGIGVKPTDPGELARYLLPVLAASTPEQQNIRRVVEDWAKPACTDVAEIVPAKAANGVTAPREARELERVDHTGKILAAVLLGLALIAVVTLIVVKLLSGSAPNMAAAATSVVTYSHENERRLREIGFQIFPAALDGVQNMAAQLISVPDALVRTSTHSQTDVR